MEMQCLKKQTSRKDGKLEFLFVEMKEKGC